LQIEGDHLGGDRRTDVCPHDGPEGLLERHQPRIDKTDDHDGGRAAALDENGDQHAGQGCDYWMGGEQLEDVAQSLSGCFLQSFRHPLHPVNKES
jgi:hypothetical protein